MKFCMITTFFGPHSFGGDAAYVDRLCQALCRRGHEVHVFYCVDAFNAVRGDHPLREYTPTPGLHLHPLESRFGILSPLATQATGRPWFKSEALREVLDDPGHRRRALPQHLAGRRAGGPRPGHEPAGRADHDGARALADLSDAPALEVRPQAVRRAELRAMLPGGRPAAAGLAADSGHRARACGTSTPWSSPAGTRSKSIGAAGWGRSSRWSTCPTSSPTAGRGGSRTRSPSRAIGRTSPPPGGW